MTCPRMPIQVQILTFHEVRWIGINQNWFGFGRNYFDELESVGFRHCNILCHLADMTNALSEIYPIEADVDFPFSCLPEAANWPCRKNTRPVTPIEEEGCETEVYVSCASRIEIDIPMQMPRFYTDIFELYTLDKFIRRIKNCAPKSRDSGIQIIDQQAVYVLLRQQVQASSSATRIRLSIGRDRDTLTSQKSRKVRSEFGLSSWIP